MPAKLRFYFAPMNAGKSTSLLQANFNYEQRGHTTLLFIPEVVGRAAVVSRIGLSADAFRFSSTFDFYVHVRRELEERRRDAREAAAEKPPATALLACVLVDECQFLSKMQVIQLACVVDQLKIPVICYGLRTDFRGEPFEGSKYLLAYADELLEIKSICFCGRKATMNQRIDANGHATLRGEQIEIGGNEKYLSKCRAHFFESLRIASDCEDAETSEVACNLTLS